MATKRNNGRKAAPVAAVAAFDFAKAFADYRAGHGAITAAARAILEGNYNGNDLFKALEADAKANDEPLSKSRVVMSLRAVWSSMKTGKGLSIKDGTVTLKDLNADQGMKSGRKSKDETAGDKANAKAGKSATKAEPVSVTSGDFETTLAHMVALFQAMPPSQFNDCRAKLAKGLAAVGIKLTD